MTRNIFFAGSITGGRADADLYLRIVEQLKVYGHVLTEHVARPGPEEGKRYHLSLPNRVGYERSLVWGSR